MAYRIGPDGFIEQTPEPGSTGTTPARPATPRATTPYRPTPAAASSEGIGWGGWLLLLFLGFIVFKIGACAWPYAVSAWHSVTGDTQSVIPQQQTPANQPEWPADSPQMNASWSIQSFGAHVQSVKYFIGGATAPESNPREYSNYFLPHAGQYMYWELNLAFPARQSRQDYQIVAYLYDSSGTLVSKMKTTAYADTGWSSSRTWDHWPEAGDSLHAGDYRMSLFVDGTKIAVGTFNISSIQVETPTPAPAAEEVHPGPAPAETPREPATPAANYHYQEQASREPEQTEAESTPEPSRPAPAPAVQYNGPTRDAVLLQRTQAIYPAMARPLRLQGQVQLTATVGANGRLHAFHVVSGNTILAGAAIQAAQQWVYAPALDNGKAVESTVGITMQFAYNH